MFKETKCRLHGNACSSVSSHSCLDGRAGSLMVVTYTNCSCERRFRMMRSEFRPRIGRYYDIGDAHDAADAATAANSLVFKYLDDLHANKYVNPNCATIAAIDAEFAARDAAAAATPGDSDEASYVNVARLAANSARAARLLLFRSMSCVRRTNCCVRCANCCVRCATNPA